MKKYTIKQLKSLVNSGAAIDVTGCIDRKIIPEHYTPIGYSCTPNAVTGKLLKGNSTNRLYVVTGDASLFMF